MAKQQNLAPITKVTVGAATGALSIIIIWAINNAIPDGSPWEINQQIASAITTVLTFIVSYLVPPARSDQVVTDAGGA